jgi:hypothetical protein
MAHCLFLKCFEFFIVSSPKITCFVLTQIVSTTACLRRQKMGLEHSEAGDISFLSWS